MKGSSLVHEWSDFLATGDGKAFYALYGHYHDYLTYVGLQKGVPSQEVKDRINDLFLYVFEHRLKLTHVKHHHNYLVTAFIRSLFSKKQFSFTDDALELADESIPEIFSYPSAEALHIHQNAREEIQAIVYRYMARLSDSQSRLIYQKFYLGLTYQEIAVANNIALKTAYNTVLQAVTKLKKLIPPEHAAAIASTLTLLGGLLAFLLFH